MVSLLWTVAIASIAPRPGHAVSGVSPFWCDGDIEMDYKNKMMKDAEKQTL